MIRRKRAAPVKCSYTGGNINKRLTTTLRPAPGFLRLLWKAYPMRNFTQLLLLSFLLFSCSKHNDSPGNNAGSNPVSTPAAPAAPVTTVSIMINDTAMHITALSYARYGSGIGGGLSITASNGTQKVTAETFNFYQHSAWDMIYQEEVSYFSREDSLSSWGGTYARPIPRDDEVRFNNFTPLSDSVVTGHFSASFIGTGDIGKESQVTTVKGTFKLVFIK